MKIERNVLVLTHNHGGGSKMFLDEYIEEEFKNCSVYLLQAEQILPQSNMPAKHLILTNFKNPSQKSIFESGVKSFNEIIKRFHITESFINHLIHFNLDFITICILSCGVPFTYFIHDYYCVCPNTYLSHCYLAHCESSADNKICRYYLDNIQIKNWREIWEIFLSTAKKIIAPSSCAASIVQNVYPNLSIEVRPHYLITSLSKTFKPEFAEREKLRITFLGLMAEHKGERYLLQLNEFIQNENLPIEFVVLGTYVEELSIGTKEGIIFAEAYNVDEVSEKLSQFETSIVAILSDWAETYCYTASEAILSGYPVMSFDIGAHSLRVAKNNCGWIFPIESPSRGFEELKNFLRVITTAEGRKDILLKAANTANFKNGDE